ncbi:hypothetical protein [Kocuria atrinae]|uniref:hypothetical protein n=1 Tax=Kocuria atrinae TaxID=592377 RepID=UPI000311FA31|nr:hypothetical protein [Kocuria atrinae]
METAGRSGTPPGAQQCCGGRGTWRQAAQCLSALRALVEAGIIKSKAEHGLGPFWRSDEVLAAIDAFAQRAGRRSAV